MKIGWYRDRSAPGRYVYWNGDQWLSRLDGVPLSWPAATPRGSRARGSRLAATIAIFAVSYVGALLLGIVFYVATRSSSTGLQRVDLLAALSTVAWVAIFSAMATRVSYRWFDALCLFIPVYSIIWMFRILWRLANLPLRDWSPRPEDLTRLLPRAARG